MFVALRYQPIALILGSDGKPAKVRVKPTNPDWFNRTWEFWLASTPAEAYLRNTDFMRQVGDTWEFLGYNRLPVLDMYYNTVEDGVVLDNRVVGKVLDSPVAVFDATGNVKYYGAERLREIALRDKTHKFFCNLNYAALSSGELRCNNLQTGITVSTVSDDISLTISMMAQHNIKFEENKVLVPQTFFNQDIVIVPDIWASMIANKNRGIIARQVVLPKQMQRLSLSLSDCPNLESLVLPEQVTGYLDLWLKGCPKIRELVLPRSVGYKLSLNLEDLPTLEKITQPKVKGYSGIVNLHATYVPELRDVVTPSYSYENFGFHKGFETVVCDYMTPFLGVGTSIKTCKEARKFDKEREKRVELLRSFVYG